MTRPTTTASPWPARCAYISAAIFTAASGLTNLTYGWQKGDTFATSLVWSGVAGAVSIVFALSWPALIRSVDARRWSAALISLVALTLSGAYSITAALGSASGGRTNAATIETATTDARTKAQAAYDAAKAELGGLKPARPAAELEPLIRSARPVCRIVVTLSRRDTVCELPPTLVAELGRSKRRAELEGKIEKATTELAAAPPPKAANTDAKVLARYLGALGFDVTADRLADLLVILAVTVLECGGGLAIAVGLSLSSPTAGHPASTAGGEVSTATDPKPAAVTAVVDALDVPAVKASTQSTRPLLATIRGDDLTDWLRDRGGTVHTSMRRLGLEIGLSPQGALNQARRLAAARILTVQASPRGTVLTLAEAGKLN